MLALKYLLMSGGFGMILAAAAILGSEVYTEIVFRKALAAGVMPQARKLRWRTSIALAMLAWGPILLTFSIVIPAGAGGCM